MKEHLRGAWGFKGYVVSDCDAVTDIADHHKYAPDPAAAVAVALKAGTDNECNTQTLGAPKDLGARYHEAWRRGLLSEGQLARLLHIDRVEAREMIDEFEAEGAVDDESPILLA